jgi:hypothetical protein
MYVVGVVDTVLCWRPLTFCVGKNGVGASFLEGGGGWILKYRKLF